MSTPEAVPAGGRHPRPLTDFAGVESWIFDLDNTLYPAETNLFLQVDERIRTYVSKLLGLGPEEAHILQKSYYQRYGTTLRGLMIEHGVSPDEFLEYVHDIDHSGIRPDPRLGEAIGRLPGKRYILTNGTQEHALAMANRLGITDRFDAIFGIVEADLLPKPMPETYDRFLALHGIEAPRAAMFEDLARNLAVPDELGMRTTLVVPAGTRSVFREAWELEGREAPHVQFVTDDLATFLEGVLAAIR